MRKLIILCLILAILPAANAVCVMPDENMEIKENAVFCHGTYNLESGIKVINDNLLVDCNNSIMVGNGINYGFLLKDRKNIALQNCDISNYEIGIYLDSTNGSIANNNRLTRNKFGIALFNSFNNDISGNFLSENIMDNKIAYLADSLLPEKEVTEAEKEEKTSPLEEIMEEVIKVKKPFFGQAEVLNEVNFILNKYFNISQENLEIKRAFAYNESDKSTKIILQLKPKKVLLNLSIYEKIPKCVSAYASEIFFETGNYEVISNEPLILWAFPKLGTGSEISYKVLKKIDEECKNLLLAFGIATGFEEFEAEKEEKSNANYLWIFSFVIGVGFVLYFMLGRHHRKYSKGNK